MHSYFKYAIQYSRPIYMGLMGFTTARLVNPIQIGREYIVSITHRSDTGHDFLLRFAYKFLMNFRIISFLLTESALITGK